MQQEASMFGVDIQAEGVGLWDVGAWWRDDQPLHTLPNTVNMLYNNTLCYFSNAASEQCVDSSDVGCAEK